MRDCNFCYFIINFEKKMKIQAVLGCATVKSIVAGAFAIKKKSSMNHKSYVSNERFCEWFFLSYSLFRARHSSKLCSIPFFL